MSNYPLMSYEEYRQTKHPDSYFFKIEKSKQYLYYIGARHSFDPDNPVFNTIRECWKDFLNKTQGRERLVLVEGGKRPVSENEPLAIREGGEAGFVTFLAAREHIDADSPEPSNLYEVGKLLNKFSKEEIIYYFFIRQVAQWNRMEQKPTLERYITKTLERYRAHLRWDGFNFSMENMKKIHRKLFGTKFDRNRRDFIDNLTNPTITDTVTNRVSCESGILRDTYIVDQIKTYWEQGKSLFIVYGKTHAIVQEPAIKAALV